MYDFMCKTYVQLMRKTYARFDARDVSRIPCSAMLEFFSFSLASVESKENNNVNLIYNFKKVLRNEQ